MLIKINRTIKGATDKLGTQLRVYESGTTEEIYEDLAKVFIEQGWGQEVVAIEEVEESEPEAIEEKAIEEVEEDKSIKKSPENKSAKKDKKKNKNTKTKK